MYTMGFAKSLGLGTLYYLRSIHMLQTECSELPICEIFACRFFLRNNCWKLCSLHSPPKLSAKICQTAPPLPIIIINDPISLLRAPCHQNFPRPHVRSPDATPFGPFGAPTTTAGGDSAFLTTELLQSTPTPIAGQQQQQPPPLPEKKKGKKQQQQQQQQKVCCFTHA